MLIVSYSSRRPVINVSSPLIPPRPSPHIHSWRKIPARYHSTQPPVEPGFESRVQEIQAAVSDAYPRLESNANRLSIEEFRTRYDYLELNQVVEEDKVVVQGRLRPHPALFIEYMYLENSFYVGRIRTARLAGSKLIFFDLVQNDHKIQGMWNLRMSADVTPEKFKQLYRLLRRGDAFCM